MMKENTQSPQRPSRSRGSSLRQPSGPRWSQTYFDWSDPIDEDEEIEGPQVRSQATSGSSPPRRSPTAWSQVRPHGGSTLINEDPSQNGMPQLRPQLTQTSSPPGRSRSQGGGWSQIPLDETSEQNENPRLRPQVSRKDSINRWSQTRSRWSIPIGVDFDGDEKPQPETRLQPRKLNSHPQERWSQARMSQTSQTRSRWSIPPADLANIGQVTPAPPPPRKPKKKGKSWRFLVAFFALAVVAFTSALDATSLSIALPIIARDLEGTSLESFWAGIAFLLTSVLFQPICTSCSDIFGRKPILYACIGIFGIGAIIFGVGKSMNVLIIGRAVQGVGGGGLEALSEIILTDMTTLKERPLWIGILGFVWAAGSVMGPLVGAVFSEFVSWRWIGWINLPLLGVAIVLIPPFLTLQHIKSSMKAKLRALDWIGIPLFIAGMTTFIIALTWGGVLFPWQSWKTIFPLILGIVLLGVFVWWESKQSEPMIPYRIFANKTGTIAIVAALLHGIILFGVLFYIPIYFEGVIGDKPLAGSVEALALSLTVTLFAIGAAFAIDYVRKYCWAVWIGWSLTTVGMGLMSLLDVDSNQATRTGLQIVGGIGLGILYPALSIPMQAAVQVDDNGLAIGTFVFARQLGAVIGLAIGSAIFTNLFRGALPAILPDVLSELRKSDAAVSFISVLRYFDLDPLELMPILKAYADALRGVWYALTAVGGVAFLLTLFMKDLSLENDAVGKQVFHDGRSDDTTELVTWTTDQPKMEKRVSKEPAERVAIPKLSPIDTAPHFMDGLATFAPVVRPQYAREGSWV